MSDYFSVPMRLGDFSDSNEIQGFNSDSRSNSCCCRKPKPERCCEFSQRGFINIKGDIYVLVNIDRDTAIALAEGVRADLKSSAVPAAAR